MQNSLLRTTKQLGAIVNGVTTLPEPSSTDALEILRNLCFVRSAYPMILKHRSCLAMLITIGRQHDGERHELAIEALAAILHRCSKAERAMLWPRLAPVLEAPSKSVALEHQSDLVTNETTH